MEYKSAAASAYEFWRNADRAYAALCALSNPDDWQHELDAVAQEAAGAVAGASSECRVLDVGAGIGDTIFRVSQRMLATYRTRTKLTLVEPAEEARRGCALRFGNAGELGGATILRSIQEVNPAARFDAILFVHSGYYIEAIESELTHLRNFLANRGKFIFTAMSDTSPFFLGLGALGHNNLAEDLEIKLLSLGAKVRVLPLRSRLSIAEGTWDNAKLCSLWASLYPQIDDPPKFKKRLREYLVDGIDLEDRIIVAEMVS